MKALLTLSLLLFFSGISLAQEIDNNQKVATLEAGIVFTTNAEETRSIQINTGIQDMGIARLYRYKNSRVKKALYFTTKKDKPKLA